MNFNNACLNGVIWLGVTFGGEYALDRHSKVDFLFIEVSRPKKKSGLSEYFPYWRVSRATNFKLHTCASLAGQGCKQLLVNSEIDLTYQKVLCFYGFFHLWRRQLDLVTAFKAALKERPQEVYFTAMAALGTYGVGNAYYDRVREFSETLGNGLAHDIFVAYIQPGTVIFCAAVYPVSTSWTDSASLLR